MKRILLDYLKDILDAVNDIALLKVLNIKRL